MSKNIANINSEGFAFICTYFEGSYYFVERKHLMQIPDKATKLYYVCTNNIAYSKCSELI